MAYAGIAKYVGQFLNWNGISENWFSPFDEFYLVDDFVTVSGGGSNVSSVVFWNSDSGGTGSGFSSSGNVLSTNPGIITLNTGTTTSGYNNLRMSGASLNDSWLLGGGAISINWVCKIPSLSNGTDTFVTRIGFGSNTNLDFVNGVYFEGDANSNANWLIKTANSSTRTSTTTSTAIDTNFHRYRIDVNASATSVTYFIDDISVGTISTNIPTSNDVSFYLQMVKSAGTTNRTILIDLFTAYQKLTTSR